MTAGPREAEGEAVPAAGPPPSSPADGPPATEAPLAPRPPVKPRGVRRIAALVLVLLAAALAASEALALRLRSHADSGDVVSADVDVARAELAERLVAIERTCADFAARALERSAAVTDRAQLFRELETLGLPAAAGVQLEDEARTVLAWGGASVDESALLAAAPFDDGTALFRTPVGWRLAVRRTRAADRPGVPTGVACHLPIEVRYPLRNRFFASWSLADEVRRAHRVGSCEILPPWAGRGTVVASAFGGDLARVDVDPLSARAWAESVDAERASRRALLLVAGTLVAAAWLAWELRRLAKRRPGLAPVLGAALIAGVRVALATVPLAQVLPASPPTDARRYSHGLPLAFAASPADLLLTCLAALGIAACLRRAAQGDRRAGASAWPGAAAALVVAACVGWALRTLVADVVANSTVEFFTDVAVLPLPASATLLAALVAAGIAGALLIAAAWTWFGPAREPQRLAMWTLAVAVSLAALPWGPSGTAGDTALLVVGTLAFAAAAAVLLLETGTAVRAATVPLGVALAVFAPLERHVEDSVHRIVESEAHDRIADVDATAREVVDDTLKRLAESRDLVEAVGARRVPRDLQVRLWAESPLASRTGGSSIVIELPGASADLSRFSVNLPPTRWLPGAEARPPVDNVSPEPLPGRGPGRDGRWIIGSRRIGDGAGIVHVTLEVRRPSNPGLPELEILGPAPEPDTLRAPALSVTRYDAAGRITLDETNDAVRPAGADVLAAEYREQAVETGEPVRGSVRVGDGERTFVVVPTFDDAGAVRAFHAFSFDAGGVRRLSLRGARALLCGALLAALALAVTARRWARGPRTSLAPRLVVSFAVVSGLPLLLLGSANFALARERAEEATLRELREAVSLLGAEIEAPPARAELHPILELSDESHREDWLRAMAYRTGHHANVFRGESGELLASSDQGLFGTELLPRRLPGPAYREVRLLGRPFLSFPARVGGETFDVGYAPIRSGSGEPAAVLAVPLLHQRRLRDTELADGITAILALYLVSLGAAIAFGTWLATRLTRPLRDLTRATQRVAAGDLASPVPEAGPGELGDVARSFNRMMRDLAESRERLVRAEKEAAWRDMARQVAHEVKNPLTPMRLAAEHLRRAWRDRVAGFDDVLERGVDLIVRQTESLQRIATAFSDFARLPGRRREPTDVADVVRRVLELYRSTPRLTIRADIEAGLPLIAADPDELHRVLVNLAKNAVEALEGRDGTLAVTLRREGDDLRLEVADDGPGIPADVVPRLFEPYFSTKTSGTGLGLAICRRAIEDLGGTIAVRSSPGAGTTVTVRLPLAAPRAAG